MQFNDVDVFIELSRQQKEPGIRRRKSLIQEKRTRDNRRRKKRSHAENYRPSKYVVNAPVNHSRKKMLVGGVLRDGHLDDLVDSEFLDGTIIANYLSRPATREIKLVPWRTKRDLKRNASKKYQTSHNRRKQYSRWGWYWGSTTPQKRRKRPYSQRKRKRTSHSLPKMEHAYVPLSERCVTNLGGIRTAYDYISRRVSKADHFYHPNPQINQALQMILTYVQSRADRGLPIDIKNILANNDRAISSRLEKWEGIHDRRIITIHDLMQGRFFSTIETDFKYSFIPVDPDIVVSSNYNRNPDRYVTTKSEFQRAIRGVFNGRITDISHFHILDPVSAITLEWCIRYTSAHPNHNLKPKDIWKFRNLELRRALQSNELLDAKGNPIPYRFHSSPVPSSLKYQEPNPFNIDSSSEQYGKNNYRGQRHNFS